MAMLHKNYLQKFMVNLLATGCQLLIQPPGSIIILIPKNDISLRDYFSGKDWGFVRVLFLKVVSPGSYFPKFFSKTVILYYFIFFLFIFYHGQLEVPVTALCILLGNLPSQTHEPNKYPFYVPHHTGNTNDKLCATANVGSPFLQFPITVSSMSFKLSPIISFSFRPFQFPLILYSRFLRIFHLLSVILF